jgi:hypothetical protein
MHPCDLRLAIYVLRKPDYDDCVNVVTPPGIVVQRRLFPGREFIAYHGSGKEARFKTIMLAVADQTRNR